MQASASPPPKASPRPRPGGLAAPVGSAARQPSHQISIAATVINGCATIRLRPAASGDAARLADRGSASPPAPSGENVLRCSEPVKLCGQDVLGLAAWSGRSGGAAAVHAAHPTAPDGARQIMLRCRCEMVPESLRKPVAPGTRGGRRPARLCYKPQGWRRRVWFGPPCRWYPNRMSRGSLLIACRLYAETCRAGLK